MLMPGLSSTATDSARVSWPNATPTSLMRAGSRVDTSPGGEAGGQLATRQTPCADRGAVSDHRPGNTEAFDSLKMSGVTA